MKYDFSLDLNSANSLSLILKNINKNATVLEFGPANGRMTKYMKEELSCRVYLVELDQEAGNQALAYGEDLVVGNAEDFQWLERYKNIRFDYIVFADVLEHLRDPERVLEKSKTLLAEDGSIFLSVPNLAHNSVLINLLNNDFDYREIGLLDNTHIHLFTKNSLEKMLESAELYPVKRMATYSRVGTNEIESDVNAVPGIDDSFWNTRKFGEVYQFVYEVKKRSDFVETQQNMLKNTMYHYFCQVYFGITGNDFDENNSSKCAFSVFDQKSVFSFDLPDEAKKVRIDPMNHKGVFVVSCFGITSEGERRELVLYAKNSVINVKNEYCFEHDDPWLCYDLPIGLKQLEVHVECLSLSADVVGFSAHLCEDINSARVNESNAADALNAELQARIEMLNEEKNALERKEKKSGFKILECKDKISLLKAQNEKLTAEKSALQAQEAQLSQTIYAMRASFCWKITAPIRGVSMLLRKTLLGKLLSMLKNYGIRGTASRLKKRREEKKKLKSLRSGTDISKAQRAEQERARFSRDIVFSVLVPLYNTPEEYLRAMIDSVKAQTYKKWQLCLADGSDSEHDYVGKIVEKYAKDDSRIVYKKLEKNGGISENTNACIDLATGNYIALFDHDDILHPSAFYEYMKAICEKNADFIYCDENTFSKHPSDAYNPHFKPDYSPDTLRSYNYICHFSVFSRELLEKVGGFRKEFDGSQDYDMILRLTEKAENIVHIPQILYYWRAHKNSVAADVGAKPYTVVAAKKALCAHLERVGLEGEVLDSKILTTYRIKYKINGEPLISIIIPTKDHTDDLKVCLDSIFEKSTYRNFEIILVENNSTDQKTFDYYDELQSEHDNIKVVVWKEGFNYSAINNFGFGYASGEYILLLNNDVEVITPNWLEEMLMFAQRSDVGAVGAMLYYPDDTIQHAGVILGIGGVAGHSHKYFSRNDHGYFARITIAQNLSCCTAACLMMSRKIFDEVGGFDESFAVAFNDVDLCMRIRKKGYLVVFTPYAELYHYESKSRGLEDSPEKIKRFNSEIKRFENRWFRELEAGDPYYNPNLTLLKEDFSLK